MPKRKFTNEEAESILTEVLRENTFDRNSPLSTQAYQLLRRNIIYMKLAPGLPLVESRIAGLMGVSRTPVREALQRLANENLVDVYPQSGNFVSPIKVGLVENAVFIRSALENANIRTLAHKITPRQLLDLKHNIQNQGLAIAEENYPQFHELDEALHRSLFHMNGRERVWDLILSIKAHLDRARIFTLPLVDMAARAYEQHRAIVAALEGCDPEGAETHMQTHLDSLTNILTRCEKEIAEYLDRDEVGDIEQ